MLIQVEKLIIDETLEKFFNKNGSSFTGIEDINGKNILEEREGLFFQIQDESEVAGFVFIFKKDNSDLRLHKSEYECEIEIGIYERFQDKKLAEVALKEAIAIWKKHETYCKYPLVSVVSNNNLYSDKILYLLQKLNFTKLQEYGEGNGNCVLYISE